MPFTYCKTPVGVARITEEDNFITSISIRDEEFEISIPESPVLKMATQQLDEYFEGKRKEFDLPIKQSGSDFQQKVWQQLLKIEYGKTISYLQQSKLMNNPLGIRAIAAANGKNNLWIVVPCHRVIGSNGSLTGYAGGLWRKKWLLEHEASIMGIGQTTLNF
ncbi:methylated-DNA-[protein]-cysteine S-methyltransferase [Mucilaginibacter frigoritolerans]|uniref:Methylated-DNA--protein-cysteine methyltransferase n=1 Tax=Mucilaginibacter frigoritolerans TaxID=652788 RepID=A0A562TT35_9SPHI|nr:methylated-DNA--[protein]-cysteine S-methyltransferase [Mucilaginibacter frigoritolerans]TWI96737.1 methylated-DNA-[protein]-cysteine S-methyltransferase [Mucilaginibacter frigoritolerans]